MIHAVGSFFKSILNLWFVGFIFLLAIFGYILYSSIWVIRLMQTKFHKIKTLLIVVLLLLSGSLIWYLFYPTSSAGKGVEITISRNTTVHAIADSLKRHQIITSVNAFRFWIHFSHLQKKIQAGKVTFMVGDGVIRAARKLLHAEPIEIVITIPEGLTIEQIAQKIHNSLPIDTSEFIRLCYDSTFVDKLQVQASSLEGYLFPNTYRLPPDIKPANIIKRIVKQFNKAYESLTPNPPIQNKFTKHEIVTLASIVEKEAALHSEQPRIAAVFHNRLRIGYPLGADPTVRYAVKKFNGPLRVSELNCNSPYNTRKFKGLPPGPICSPGLGALQAAVTPLETKELYFVAKWDGSGAHDFSLSNAEHTRKKLLIRHQNELRKKSKEIQCKK